MEIPFRITVLHPPPGVAFRLQRGRTGLEAPSHESAGVISFDFTLRVEPGKPGAPPRLLGPFAQGPPAARFVYVNSGTYAGQRDSCWSRRAKVPLAAVEPSLLEEAAAASPGTVVIEARIAGTGRNGGPACASVPLARAWQIAPR